MFKQATFSLVVAAFVRFGCCVLTIRSRQFEVYWGSSQLQLVFGSLRYGQVLLSFVQLGLDWGLLRLDIPGLIWLQAVVVSTSLFIQFQLVVLVIFLLVRLGLNFSCSSVLSTSVFRCIFGQPTVLHLIWLFLSSFGFYPWLSNFSSSCSWCFSLLCVLGVFTYCILCMYLCRLNQG